MIYFCQIIMGKSLKFLIFTLPFLFVFVSSLYHPQDPDLGWHLKYGEHFIKTGQILKENIYSVEMPAYRWVNSSWLTDLITYSVFNNFGFLGLSIAAATVITATFFFFSKAAELDFFEKSIIFPLLVVLLSPLNSVSFRGQLLSLMLLGLLYLLLNNYEKTKSKIVFLIVPLFALWSNLHGQFLLGLAFLLLWTASFFGTKLIKNQSWDLLKEEVLLITVVALSPFAALLNPFGFGVYLESFKHFSNPLLKSVVEWLPQEELSPMWLASTIIGFMMFFGAVLVTFSQDIKGKLKDYLLATPFFVMSFVVRRYSWPMFYISMPALSPTISFLKPPSKTAAEIFAFFILILSLVITLIVTNPISRIRTMSQDSYCEKFVKCSPQAAKFLKENKYPGNFMNLYGWGGWLIWSYPEIKPNIDGRMHLWQENGQSAFSYYFDLEQNVTDIDTSKYDVVLMTPKKPVYDRLKELTFAGKWRLVYEDEFAGVFVRN